MPLWRIVVPAAAFAGLYWYVWERDVSGAGLAAPVLAAGAGLSIALVMSLLGNRRRE